MDSGIISIPFKLMRLMWFAGANKIFLFFIHKETSITPNLEKS